MSQEFCRVNLAAMQREKAASSETAFPISRQAFRLSLYHTQAAVALPFTFATTSSSMLRGAGA